MPGSEKASRPLSVSWAQSVVVAEFHEDDHGFAPPFEKSQAHTVGTRILMGEMKGQAVAAGRGRRRTSVLGGSKVAVTEAADPAALFEALAEHKRRTSVQLMATAVRSRWDQLREDTSCVLDPNALFMKKWDAIMMLLLVFTALFTPFEVAFMETRLDAVFWINRVVDLGFMVDIGIAMRTSFFDERRSMWVMNKGVVRKHYLRGWFLVDLLSLVFSLLDVLSLVLDSSELSRIKILRALKLLKLFKLLRIIKLAAIVKRLQTVLGLSHAAKGMLNFFIAVLCVVHWQACLWRLGPQFEGSTTGNWITTLQEATPPLLPATPSRADLYLASIEFSLMALVMSVGNTAPVTSFERGVAVLCMVIGGTVYISTIGSICGLVSMRDPATTQYQETVDLVNKFLEENAVPGDIRTSLREYMKFSRELIRSECYHKVQRTFPPSLQEKLALFLNEEWIAGLHFFHAEDEQERGSFIQALCTRLEMAAFPPEERIFSAGEPASHLFIIRRGLVAKMGRIFGRSRCIGEDMICRDNVRRETAVALSYVDCSTLSQSDLLSLLEQNALLFSATRALVRRAAIRIAMRLCVMEIGVAALELRRLRGAVPPSTTATRTKDLALFRMQLVLKAEAKAKAAAANGGKGATVARLQRAAAAVAAVGSLDRARDKQQEELASHLHFWTRRDSLLASEQAPGDGAAASADTFTDTLVEDAERALRGGSSADTSAETSADTSADTSAAGSGAGRVELLLERLVDVTSSLDSRLRKLENTVQDGFQEVTERKYNAGLYRQRAQAHRAPPPQQKVVVAVNRQAMRLAVEHSRRTSC